MITVEQLTRRFGSTLAVDSIGFSIEKGEVVGLLGANGAGKTTTLRMLTGYLPPTSGSVRIAGLDVLRQSLEVRRRIGYLPESVPLYREHRVREMLEFQARLHGLTRREWKQRIPAVLERVRIADRSESLIGALSRGQRQRVGLAVALLPAPEVLILDEPTSGLDPLQRIEVRHLVSELAREHTLLVSSHILPEIEAVCPRVIVLHRGRIAADGSQSELAARIGGGAHVRIQAVVGRDAGEAARLLGALRGVREVIDEGRLGIHHGFRVLCEEDLREDVGALAASRGWALRELSWQRPRLEELFTRIALDLEPAPRAASVPAPGAQPTPVPGELVVLSAPGVATPAEVPEAYRPLSPFERPAPKKQVYNLNPFDQGARRDLGRPKSIEDESPPSTGAG